MPGMTMPGCRQMAGPSGFHLFTPGSAALSFEMRAALLSALGLAALGLIMFLWRLLWHRRISGFRWGSDWLGHGGAHAVGMLLMTTLMLGWASTIGPLWAYVATFGALALLFAVGAVVARDQARRTDDLWHVFVQLSMVYMFGILWLGPVVALTAAFLVFYGAFTAGQVREALREAGPDARLRDDHGPGRLAGTIGHLAISGSMVVMFVVMQWPALFHAAG